MTEIKICGITRPEEIEYLNQLQVDYAGFVFYERSRRNIEICRAAELVKLLDQRIRSVAVTVSPDGELIKRIEQAGFEILQVHGKWREKGVVSRLPIWRAVNISGGREALEQLSQEEAFENPEITGFVADGASYGSGKTFCWAMAEEETADSESEAFRQLLERMKKKTFVLAGGLHAGNVSEGIRLFAPDVVDVSTGVEGRNGKEKSQIEEFVEHVKNGGKHG